MHCSFPSDIVMIMEDMEDMMMPMPGNCSMGGMAMNFYFGFLHSGLLFSGWNVRNPGELIGSIIAIVVLAILYEGLKSLREFLMTYALERKKKELTISVQQSGEKRHLLPDQSQPTTRLITIFKEYLSVFHILQSLLHVIQVGLGYLLMLVAMTFNGYLFLAVCFGAGIGYFIFGVCKKRSTAGQNFREQNEHCGN